MVFPFPYDRSRYNAIDLLMHAGNFEKNGELPHLGIKRYASMLFLPSTNHEAGRQNSRYLVSFKSPRGGHWKKAYGQPKERIASPG